MLAKALQSVSKSSRNVSVCMNSLVYYPDCTYV